MRSIIACCFCRGEVGGARGWSAAIAVAYEFEAKNLFGFANLTIFESLQFRNLHTNAKHVLSYDAPLSERRALLQITSLEGQICRLSYVSKQNTASVKQNRNPSGQTGSYSSFTVRLFPSSIILQFYSPVRVFLKANMDP